MKEIGGRPGFGPKYTVQQDPMGCFGANLESVTGIAQSDINSALEQSGLYSSDFGMQSVPDSCLDESLEKYGVEFEEVLPHYDPFNESEDHAAAPLADGLTEHKTRVRIVHDALENMPIILFYPRKRLDQDPFLHAVLITRNEQEDLYTLMDPSEVDGGLFSVSEEEIADMLTPYKELGIPVFAYGVRSAEYKTQS